MDRWRNKVAVVTGASSGIGAAIAEKLVEFGVIVAGLARRVHLVEALSKKLADKPGKLYAFQADVSKEEDIFKTFDYVKKNLGCISILVNNAALVVDASCIEGETKDWEKILGTNLVGLSIGTREAVKQMRENNVDGHVIHINSVVGHKVVEYIPPMYIASKFAITALTECLRQELNQLNSKIKISSISPGITETEILTANELEKNDSTKDLFEKAPHLNAVDVANAVLYVLATPPHVQVHDIIIKPIGERI